MDAPLIALTQQCNGDLRQLLFAFFSFLNRRTDFYLVPHPDDIATTTGTNNVKMGFAEGDAEKLLLAAFRQFPLRRIPKGGIGAAPTAAAAAPAPGAKPTNNVQLSESTLRASNSTTASDAGGPKTTNETAVGKPGSTNGTKNDAGNILLTSEKKDRSDTGSIDNNNNKKKEPSQEDDNCPSNMKGVEYNEEGLQIPVGNGGSTPRYKWTQTLDETTVLIGIPKTFRGKDLDVTFTPSRISVKAKKKLPGEDHVRTFIDGDLVERIRPDESTWSVEGDGGVMMVTLDKLKKAFWPTVIVGDEKIDTELVDSRRHISDYDDVTQAQIRKIIFDQNQYHKGLPSSDEILGKKSEIPDLPPGVEYIDKKLLDAADKIKTK
jgi:hypothetical protein